MLAPPNSGSEYGDLAREAKLTSARLVPPAVAALGTDPAGFAQRLPPPSYPVGVIAGTRSLNPLDAVLTNGESDGAVSVESAQLPGMTDFITVNDTHSSIRRDPAVHAQVIAFLRNGRFNHSESGVEPGNEENP
jgi:hypothetical protein